MKLEERFQKEDEKLARTQIRINKLLRRRRRRRGKESESHSNRIDAIESLSRTMICEIGFSYWIFVFFQQQEMKFTIPGQ